MSFAEMNSSIVQFASSTSNQVLLPIGPALNLPAGILGVFNRGMVFSHGPWVVAVGVGPTLFFILDVGSSRCAPAIVREQLVGYLSACGVEVLRLRIRFPLTWHNSADLRRTVIYWVFAYVETLFISVEPTFGKGQSRGCVPIGISARQARAEWLWLGGIWRAIEDECPQALPQADWLLWEVSRRWEVRWSLIIRDAERNDSITAEERAEVEQCDRVWANLIRRYLERHGYEMIPHSVARLL